MDTFEPMEPYKAEVKLYKKYHGMGYYQVIIERPNDQYQLLLCGGSNSIERDLNGGILESYILHPGRDDILLDRVQLELCIELTCDSYLATMKCRDILCPAPPV